MKAHELLEVKRKYRGLGREDRTRVIKNYFIQHIPSVDRLTDLRDLFGNDLDDKKQIMIETTLRELLNLCGIFVED